MKKTIIIFIILFCLCGCGNKTNNLIGTWEIKSSNTIIILENGEELILNPQLNITEDNLSEDGSCGGSSCKSFIYSNDYENIQVYSGNLCYELVDKDTLKQVKCYSDNISGIEQMENQTEHDIIYKKIK